MNEGVPKVSTNGQEKPKNETPQFIKDFSRGNSQEERDRLAGTLREKRRERDVWRQEHSELVTEQEQMVAELEDLTVQIEEYNSEGFLQKIAGYLKYRELRAKVSERQGTLSEVETSRQMIEQIPPQFEEPKRLLEEFYKGEEKKWVEAGHTKEDIQKHFSEKNLSKLAVEEYALLMRRFPGEMVTHVTRQGIRDHASTHWHTAGIGTFSNSFKDVLLDGRLRPALGIALQEHSKEEAIVKFLKLDKVNSRDEALAHLNRKFEGNLSTGEAFADSSSVHVASEVVMNGMYGSEGGNEIFFAFPSAYIASGFHYGGKGDLFDGSTDQHNDKWIHTKDHEGISLDSGLVFIPAEAHVHPDTGSRYEIDKNGEPLVNEAYRIKFKEVISAQDFKEFAEGAKLILGGTTQRWNEPNLWDTNKVLFGKLEPYCRRLEDNFGIIDQRLQFAILDYDTLRDIGYHPDELDKYIDEGLKKESVYYVEAKQSVTSQEYWEQYFTEHPDQRPSKIVYYTGGDPSRAMNEWRRKNKIVKNTSDKAFGFQENKVTGNSPEANQGKDQFMELARKIIDDRFPEIRDPDEDHDLKEAEMMV